MVIILTYNNKHITYFFTYLLVGELYNDATVCEDKETGPANRNYTRLPARQEELHRDPHPQNGLVR